MTVSNTDNDTAGFTLTQAATTLAEPSGTTTFTVVLNSEPTGSVTVAVSSGDTTEAMVSSSSLTFTTSNWSTAQTITLTAVEDYTVDGTQPITLTATPSSSADSAYNALGSKTSYGIVCDGTNLYVADTLNHAIRKIVISSGVVTTLAGTKGASGSADGTSTAATFNQPYHFSNGVKLKSYFAFFRNDPRKSLSINFYTFSPHLAFP